MPHDGEGIAPWTASLSLGLLGDKALPYLSLSADLFRLCHGSHYKKWRTARYHTNNAAFTALSSVG